MSGRLILCGVSLGNPDDISPRVIKTLQSADLIAAEDTRSAGLLLSKFNIRKELISFYDHNEPERVPQIIALLKSGKTIALISEAGMPLISDPGYHLIKAVYAQNIPLDAVPGPTALITALAVSGLPTDSFNFQGFLPAKAGPRQKTLAELKNIKPTLIFYEAPHRILETLLDIAEIFPERICFVGRELTKKYQEYLRGTAKEILAKLKTPRGEFVIVLEGNKESSPELSMEIIRLAGELKKAGLAPARISQILAEVFSLPKNKLKELLFTP